MKYFRVGDVVDLQRGTTYKGSLLGETGPVLLGLATIKPHGGFRFDNYKRYSGESPAKLILAPGDLFVSLKDVTQNTSLLGAVARVPASIDAGRLTQDTVKLEFKTNRISRNYLYWQLRSPQYREYCRGRATGTTTLGLSREDFLDYIVPEPTKYLENIVTTLEAIEEKIYLNKTTNETIEAMVKTIFKEWFVDFGPVKAKAEGKKPFGLDDDIAAQFPNTFKESQCGLIPNDWSVNTLYSLGNWQNGMTFKSDHFSNDGLPVIKIAELKDGIDNATKRTNIDHDQKFKIDDNSILFSWSGSPDTSIDTFVWDSGPAWLNQHIFKVTSETYSDTFVYFSLKHFKPTFIEIARNKQTTGLGHVTVTDLKRLLHIYPSPPVLKAFDRTVSPLFEKYFLNLKESQSLAATRDLLLPKLIFGKVEV